MSACMREGESASMHVCERERVRVCIYVSGRESVSMHVCERERVRVCEREKVIVCERRE